MNLNEFEMNLNEFKRNCLTTNIVLEFPYLEYGERMTGAPEFAKTNSLME